MKMRTEQDAVESAVRHPMEAVVREGVAIDREIREGRFQRGLAAIAGLSSILSGLEVTYEHYRGSYSQRVMYTPVILSPALLGVGLWTAASRRGVRPLRVVSILTLADCAIGFALHVRGIARKPGGWRLPVANIVMGPPLFAPLLFGTSAYLGLVASYMRREDAPPDAAISTAMKPVQVVSEMAPQRAGSSLADDVREGRFQKHVARATAAATFFSGVEALYSHYKNNFRYRSQWTPIAIAPALIAAAVAATRSRRAAHTYLPALSVVAIGDGLLGFWYHGRGVLRRPGGWRLPFYNVMYGPPIFAPLLFAACGFLGVLASLLRREPR